MSKELKKNEEMIRSELAKHGIIISNDNKNRLVSGPSFLEVHELLYITALMVKRYKETKFIDNIIKNNENITIEFLTDSIQCKLKK